jgi:hypothetical protein
MGEGGSTSYPGNTAKWIINPNGVEAICWIRFRLIGTSQTVTITLVV